MEVIALAREVSTAGLPVIFVLIIYGLYKKWWVPGWLFRDVQKERDEYKELAFSATDLADKLATIRKRQADARLAKETP